MLTDILQIARDHNSSKGISGLLLYTNRTFIQNLEGPKDEVLKLLVKIRKDKRHIGVMEVFAGEIEERNFSGWSMGYEDIPDEELEVFERLIEEDRILSQLENTLNP